MFISCPPCGGPWGQFQKVRRPMTLHCKNRKVWLFYWAYFVLQETPCRGEDRHLASEKILSLCPHILYSKYAARPPAVGANSCSTWSVVGWLLHPLLGSFAGGEAVAFPRICFQSLWHSRFEMQLNYVFFQPVSRPNSCCRSRDYTYRHTHLET